MEELLVVIVAILVLIMGIVCVESQEFGTGLHGAGLFCMIVGAIALLKIE